MVAMVVLALHLLLVVQQLHTLEAVEVDQTQTLVEQAVAVVQEAEVLAVEY
jgi:hypothetical protein